MVKSIKLLKCLKFTLILVLNFYFDPDILFNLNSFTQETFLGNVSLSWDNNVWLLAWFVFVGKLFIVLVKSQLHQVLFLSLQAEFTGIQELIFGGVLYAIGVCFFKSDGVLPCAHAIWHMFVGTAASVHYYAILNHLYAVSPPPDAVSLW